MHIRKTLAAFLFIFGTFNIYASPLDTTWTQVGHMNGNDAGMFNGNCNLLMTCTYASDGTGDFWTPLVGADEILFVTGDGNLWGQALYSDLLALINPPTDDFDPNLLWIDAGRGGVSIIGPVVGNVLHRVGGGSPEDPWVTLQGGHCELGCSEQLWGESNWATTSFGHQELRTQHAGVNVYARTIVPEPSSIALLGLGLIAMGIVRRRKAAQ
jgi:hypothetical protein